MSSRKMPAAPERTHEKYDRLIALAKTMPAVSAAVAHPCDEASLSGAMEAAEAGLIVPILVGPKVKIEAVAKQNAASISEAVEIVDVAHSQEAAMKAVELVRSGRAEVLDEGQPAHR